MLQSDTLGIIRSSEPKSKGNVSFVSLYCAEKVAKERNEQKTRHSACGTMKRDPAYARSLFDNK